MADSHVAVPTGNDFQRKSLKIFDFHPPLGRLLSFVA